MNNLYGLTNLKIVLFTDAFEANSFLAEHNGEIVQIQNSDSDILIVYHEVEIDG